MQTGTCNKTDCTVSSTGICLELFSPITDCPNFSLSSEDDNPEESTKTAEISESAVPSEQASAVLTSLPNAPRVGPRRFHAGTELGLRDASDLMRTHYAHLIGVLGRTNAGKTAFISALYLMATRGWLKPAYDFAGSLTLQGFEDRSRRVRIWEQGHLADTFMLHTQLSNPRSPSFMHLALKELKENRRRIELLLTDLPGEWSSALIKRIETAVRFGFLKRADGIVFVIDGPLLARPDARHAEVEKAKLLLARLQHTPLVDPGTPLVLLISKCDELNMNAPPAVDQIQTEALALGLNSKVILCSAFSRNPTGVHP